MELTVLMIAPNSLAANSKASSAVRMAWMSLAILTSLSTIFLSRSRASNICFHAA